jgi:hypothetical protein
MHANRALWDLNAVDLTVLFLIPLLCCFGGVAAATPPKQLHRCILTDYFNSYNFSKLK